MAFKIDTNRSIYKPIEFEIDGVKFTVQHPICNEFYTTTNKILKKGIEKGNTDPVVDEWAWIFGVKPGTREYKILKHVDYRTFNEMMIYISECSRNPERLETEEEKKD